MPGPISEPWTGENFEPDIVTRLLDVFEIFEDGCPDLYPAAYKEVARDAKEAAEEIERLLAMEARVRAEIAAQPYRHHDAPCTDACVGRVCDDILAALNPQSTSAT